MSVRSGELRDRVTIQALTHAPDAFGSAGADTWTDIAMTPTVAAAVEVLSGREYFEAQRTSAEVTHRVRLRYRPDYAAVLTPKHRLLCGARVLDILATLEVERREQLHVLVAERV